LAPILLLEASASATSSDGRTAECLLSWIVELGDETRRSDGVLEYSATAGGEVYRSVLDETGAGQAFHADAFGEAIVRWTLPDEFEFEVPINETAEGRFWRNLAHLEGTIDNEHHVSGEWECGPFDIDQGGYLDADLPAPGQWTLEPQPETPSDPCAVNNGDCDVQTTCTNEDGVPVCGACPEGLAGNGTIGCFECHADDDCPEGEICSGNECHAG
jgi:hypothetical protein